MTQEIIEAVREIERDKGIEEGALVAALEDALLAAQTAKQVILQRIREEERRMMYDEYIDRVGEVVTGIVQQAGDRNNVLVDLGKVESLLPRSEQVDGERYEQGSRIKAVITEVRSGTKGPQAILSRRDPELIRALVQTTVPEPA